MCEHVGPQITRFFRYREDHGSFAVGLLKDGRKIFGSVGRAERFACCVSEGFDRRPFATLRSASDKCSHQYTGAVDTNSKRDDSRVFVRIEPTSREISETPEERSC